MTKYRYKRKIDLLSKIKARSLFLLGPRATGKSFWIRKTLNNYPYIDLLNSEIYFDLLSHPAHIESYIPKKTKIIIIDEIQRIPSLLNEVQRLIETQKINFLLTGSSARKLKRGGANMLAGRARMLKLFPLVSAEIDNFDLLQYCRYGGLPLIYNSDMPWSDLKDYVHLYIKQEIQEEALVRKIDHFARFLDIFGHYSGEEINYQNISSDAAVPERTVSNFVQILIDTLLVTELKPLSTKKRKAVNRSKLYFFDVGVANYLGGRKKFLKKSKDFGIAFEHFIIQEIRAYLSYQHADEKLYYWRTYQGDEVDLIIGNKLAIEIKSTTRIQERYLKGLKKLDNEKIISKFMIVSNDPQEKYFENIHAIPINIFLKKLWQNKIIKID